ncbi:iron ABC transporter permease [Metasolibacillus sp. FSL K6-0083]|uniref:FecCD family ABC transporter permease n=1 Tax=Metasolibacillus sp. FSL K6-0083 TaxID=2921416 RepID=UPI00079527E7|nr:ferrichrome ABC transporter permease [[Bacillus] sp. KCTC 13219]
MRKVIINEKISIKKNILYIFILCMITFGAVILSIRFGASNLTYSMIYDAILHFDATNATHIILTELRIPRAIAALIVGAALAVSGAIMQAVTRNPLASPSIMGVTAGASFAVAITYASVSNASFYLLAFSSFIGAGLGTALVFAIAAFGKGGVTPVKLALCGSAITTFLTGLTTTLGLKFDISKDVSFWYAGGLASIQHMHIRLAIPFIVVGIALAFLLSKSITILSLGDETAKGLGVHTGRIRILSTIVVLLLTGAAVSIAGMIGFVGLIIPHIVRMLIGTDYRWIIPTCAIVGGGFLLFADIVARIVNSPFETPVGAITAIIGVPFFLYLARNDGRAI